MHPVLLGLRTEETLPVLILSNGPTYLGSTQTVSPVAVWPLFKVRRDAGQSFITHSPISWFIGPPFLKYPKR